MKQLLLPFHFPRRWHWPWTSGQGHEVPTCDSWLFSPLPFPVQIVEPPACGVYSLIYSCPSVIHSLCEHLQRDTRPCAGNSEPDKHGPSLRGSQLCSVTPMPQDPGPRLSEMGDHLHDLVQPKFYRDCGAELLPTRTFSSCFMARDHLLMAYTRISCPSGPFPQPPWS